MDGEAVTGEPAHHWPAREGRVRVWRWFSREQWSRLHTGDQQTRMAAIWDDLETFKKPHEKCSVDGVTQLLLSHVVQITRTGGSAATNSH
jgi:hypothetical protein